MENAQIEQPERYEELGWGERAQELYMRSINAPTPAYIADVPFDAAGAAVMIEAARVDEREDA